jgi:hypothetical protein
MCRTGRGASCVASTRRHTRSATSTFSSRAATGSCCATSASGRSVAGYRFGDVTVTVDEVSRVLVSWFADGTCVTATPNHRVDDYDLAAELGYGDDTWAMSKDHELAHHWLGPSRVLWALAHPYEPDRPSDRDIALEEAAVLDFQRGLDKNQPRPWDPM